MTMYGKPWALEADVLQAILADGAAPLAVQPRCQAKAPQMDFSGGVAVVPIVGLVTKRQRIWGGIFEETITDDVKYNLWTALDLPAVKAVILSIDSPGGGVDGTAELASFIYKARGEKPIVAWTDGRMTSAAYWIGSAADQVFISGDTVRVGSIGIVAAHRDVSGAEKKLGVKTTEVVAGRYKRIASSYAPLSPEGRQYIQDAVDYLYSAFVSDVARFRGVSAAAVLERMAGGKVFFGRQAVNAGLVDGVSTMEELIGKLSAGEPVGRPVAAGAVAAVTEKTKEEPMKVKVGEQVIDVQDTLEIDAKWISENCPGFFSSMADAHRGEGATAERERIRGIEENALPGYEAIVAEAKESVVEGTVEERAKAKWDKDAGLRAEFGAFETFLAWTKASEAGLAKVFAGRK